MFSPVVHRTYYYYYYIFIKEGIRIDPMIYLVGGKEYGT